jgi:hypothetical protein
LTSNNPVRLTLQSTQICAATAVSQARTDKDRRIKNHIRQIEALLGHPITITPEAA